MQSSHALHGLPVLVGCLVLPLAGQVSPSAGSAAPLRYRITNDGEWFYQEAGGKRLARLARGAIVDGGEAQGEWLRITVEGWIFGTSVGPTPRAGFDLAVTRAPEENLRSAPAGALVAKLAEGFLLVKLSEDGRWVRVKRDGWVRRDALEPVPVVVGARAAAPDTSPGGLPPSPSPRSGVPDTLPAAPPDPARMQPARQTALYRAPDGPAAGSLDPDTPLRVLSRSGEWTRVQFEGWVKSADLQAAPPGVLVGVSAAELRADPARYEGKVLRWTLQFIGLQQADELRPDIPSGATYFLARGPMPERGFVYVVVPPARLAAVQTLSPLATIQVSGRVRAGRSRFLGHPVVDLLTLESQP
ncbi:MAG: hypothetical protein ACREL9_08360 [Gemmatimonadales bacterium]